MNTLVAYVRQVGAQGIFYAQTFKVEAADMTAAKEEWFAKYGPQWELNHFMGLRLENEHEEAHT